MRDQVADSSNIYLEPGQGSTTCRVQIVDDDIREDDETFTVRLASLSSGTLGADITSTVFIVDDDGKCRTKCMQRIS